MSLRNLYILREEGEDEVPAAPGSDELYAVTVDTYESEDYPIVRHIFYGRTKEEAMKYLEAHKKTDSFFGKCYSGKMGDIECRNVTSNIERVDPEEVGGSAGSK